MRSHKLGFRHAIIRIWQLLTLLLLLSSTLADAHMLNMTRVYVTVDLETREMRTWVNVDLTRLMDGPKPYYALTQLPPEQQAAQMTPVTEKLLAGMHFYFGDEELSQQVERIVLPDLEYEEYEKALAAPMSEIWFLSTLPENDAELSFATDVGLPVELPLIFSVNIPTLEQRMTRWLDLGQKSEGIALSLAPAKPESIVAQSDDGKEPPLARQPAAPAAPTPVQRSWLHASGQYLYFGFTHILPKGLDHILFVLGLFLLAIRWKPLLAQVTCFTVAHSITLALAVLGFVSLSPKIVEPLIALSIAYVGIENIFHTNLTRTRLAVVFLFGLLHGMGFAGVLMELGLPRTEFVPALVFFNVGVELGQISVLCLAFLALGWFRNRNYYKKFVLIPGSAAISLVAIYWTFQRISF